MEGSIQMKNAPLFFKKTDLFFLGFFLLIAVILWLVFASVQGSTAVVRVNGEPLHTLSLSENKEITVENNGYRMTIQVNDRAVAVTESTCPDGICRRTGAIRKGGQTIVCLPAACSVTVENAAPATDGITY